MADFRKLADGVWASPQITTEAIVDATSLGITLIINNRPDGEDSAAPQGADIEAAARASGIDYVAIPVGHSGISEVQIDATVEALGTAKGGALAYCRSGTRSTLLWALARARCGDDPDDIAQAARAAGYDVTPIRPMIDMLAAR